MSLYLISVCGCVSTIDLASASVITIGYHSIFSGRIGILSVYGSAKMVGLFVDE